MSPWLNSLPALVGVAHKVGVCSRPSLHATRVHAKGGLFIKVLKVLGVQGVLDCGLMGSLSAVEVVPVNAIEEWMALQHTTWSAELSSLFDAYILHFPTYTLQWTCWITLIKDHQP